MTDPFDPAKDVINQAKHGLSLAFGDRIFDDAAHTVGTSFRDQDKEERFKVIGMVDGKVFTGVFTWRDGVPRFISVRRSNRNEERHYHSR